MKTILLLAILSGHLYAIERTADPAAGISGVAITPSSVSSSGCLQTNASGSVFKANCGDAQGVVASSIWNKGQLINDGSSTVKGAGGLGVTYGVSAGSATISQDLAVQGQSVTNGSATVKGKAEFQDEFTVGFSTGISGGKGSLSILAHDTTVKPFLAIRQDNLSNYGYDLAAETLSVGRLDLHGNNGGAQTPLMSWKRDGTGVGIGTTAPATSLDVNGNAQFGSGATKSTMTATAQIVTPKIMLSKEGGYLVKMVNDSGAIITSGTVVNSTGSAANYGFEKNPVSGYQALGTIYGPIAADPVLGECASAADCWVCVSGICPVVITGVCTRGQWMGASDTVAGAAECADEPGGTPPTQRVHDLEVGHNIVAPVAGIGWGIAHFR